MNRLTSIQIGDIGETILLTELKMRGLSVAIPFGHLDPFDLIVVTPRGRCIKVQVKCTSKPTRGGAGHQFQNIKNTHLNDVYAFLLVDRWCFMSAVDVGKAVKDSNRINLNKKMVRFDNYEIFD